MSDDCSLGMHSNINQTVSTADWKKSTIVTVNNDSANSPPTNCGEATFPKNSEASSGSPVIEKAAMGKDENLSTLNPSLTISGGSNNQKSVGTYSESHSMSCERVSLTDKSLVSSCDESATGYSGSAADSKCSNLVLNNQDNVASAIASVCGASQPSKAKKPKRTINLYLAERKNLPTSVVTMIQSNPCPITSKSWVSCQETANSSICNTGIVNHGAPALAVVLKSHHSQPEVSSLIETEVVLDDHVTTICAVMDSVLPDLVTENPEKVLPNNDTAINQNTVTAKINSNFEETVDIIECCQEAGVHLSSEEAFQSTLLKEQQLDNNELITRTDTRVAVTYPVNEADSVLSASNKSTIEVVTAEKRNSNSGLGICCHCKKFEIIVRKYDNEQRNGLRKCKYSAEERNNYLERDYNENPYISKIQRDLISENKPTQILFDREKSNLDEIHDPETSSDLLENCQGNDKGSCRESYKKAVENLNLADCEAADEFENGSQLDYKNLLRDLRDPELLIESRNNCLHGEHILRDELACVLIKENTCVSGKEQANVHRSKHSSVLDKNQPIMLQIQFVSCSSDSSVSRVTSGLELVDAMQEEKDPTEGVPCSVVENISRFSSESTVVALQSPQSSYMGHSDDKVMGLFSGRGSSWSNASTESQSKLSICHNGHVLVMSDNGQNWLPITASSLMSIPNDTLVPLPNASPIAFHSHSMHNASSSIQLIGSLNPIVLPTINHPLTIFLPSSQVIPLVSQPQVISPSLIVPYHQLYGTAVQVASMSSVSELGTVLSTNIAQDLHATSVVDANHLSNCVTSDLTSDAEKNNSKSVVCLQSSSESSVPCDLPKVSSRGDTTINVIDASLNSMETTSVMPISQGNSQEVNSLCSSETLLDSGKKNLKRKLSINLCAEPDVINVCRKRILSSPSKVFKKQGLHLEAQIENSQVQKPKSSERFAQSSSLSVDLAGEEIANSGISKLSSNIGLAHLQNSISTRNLCSSVIITQSSPSDNCLNSSVSNLNEDGEHNKNLLDSDLQSSSLTSKTDECVAGHSVEASKRDSPLSLLQNKPVENSGNKEPLESLSFVENALLKPSLWLLNFESGGKLPPANLTADDANTSQFSGSKSSGWPVLTSPQHSQILHNDSARNGQSFSAAVITQESSSSASSKRESEHSIIPAVPCAELQRGEICAFFEPTASVQVEKACRADRTSEESGATQVMNHGRSIGSVVAHLSPHQKDELNQSTLLSHEHWLPDISYRNSMLRPYELETINLDKHIWAPAVDVNKIDQLNLSVNTISQISGQEGIKRPSKTSKSQKKKLISKVWADSESGRSVGNAMFSFNAPIASQHKEFSFQSFLPPPLPPLSQKSTGEGLLEAADRPTDYREVYQSLKSRQPENSNMLVLPPTQVNEMIASNDGAIEKQNVESFNEDSSNVLSDALNFADNDEFPQIYLDEMDTIMDTQLAHGKPSNQTKSMVAAWHQDLFGSSSKRSKLRDREKTDVDANRHVDLDDRFPIHHRQDLFGFSGDVFTENDDSSAVGSFSNVLLNRKANMSSNSSWQLPVFSESLNTVEKFSYLTANEHAFVSGTSKTCALNNLYAATDSSSFHQDSAQAASCTSSSRPKNIASGGIFCLAQHAEKSDTTNNQSNGQSYDFSYSLKEFPGTCRVESSKINLEQTFGLRNRNFPDYSLPFYNEFSMEKSYGNNVRCPPQSTLWPSYRNKDQTKPTYASTSSAVVSSATQLSFRPQVEVEYSNESHKTKVSAVQITSDLLSHSHGSYEKDGRGPVAALSTSAKSMDGLTYTGSSWNDHHVRDQSFLPDSPWKSSYCASSSLRLGTVNTAPGNSPRNAFSTSSGSAELNGRACDQFHFSIPLPPSTIHGSALPSSTTLPPFSLACLPLEHSSSFSFNLTVPDMNSADVTSNQFSQEKRNQFSFYPLEHIEDHLPQSGRITSPPPCSQVTMSNFTLNGNELSSKNNSIRRNEAESLQHHGKFSLNPDGQIKPLPSFFNIASYGMKDKILEPVCSEAFPHSIDLGSSSSLIHSNSAAVAHAMSFSPTSITNSCSINAYHPQNFYHHGATFPGSLTSPPLHHPPLAADRRLNSEPQSKFDSSFSLRGLQFPPVLNFVPPPHPHPHPPTFDSPMVRFSSQIMSDPTTVCVSENSIGKASHLSENISSKVPSGLLLDQHAKQPIPSETRSSKSSSKRSSRSSKKLSNRQMTHNDRNVTDTVNPYFALPNFSSGKNHSVIPTYFSSHPFRSEGSCTTSSFNPLLTGPQASLNLQQPPSCFVNISTSTQMPHTTSVPVLPPIHNFGFGNLFSDLNNPTALSGDGMSISPVKVFPKGVPPPCVLPKQTTFDPSPLHHQAISKISPMFLNRTTASSPPNILHSMSINSLLGHHPPRFEDVRTVKPMAAVTPARGDVSGGVTMPFGLYRP